MIIKDIESAANALLAGQVVAIPTETVYGLAASVSHPSAIAQVFALKQRPLNHPLILHVAAGSDIRQWVQAVTPDAETLMENFWPGPLTLVFRTTAAQVPMQITGGQLTVAIRCPAHPIAQAVLARTGPLVAPSANPFGQVSPTTAAHVAHAFDESLLILDGGRCAVGIESTIVSVLAPEGYQLLRAGMIHEGLLQTVVVSSAKSTSDNPRVSGQLERHYQPQKPIYWFEQAAALEQALRDTQQSIWVVAFTQSDPISMAHEWYFQLHEADASTAEAIFVQLPPDTVEWAGLRDRILRAGIHY